MRKSTKMLYRVLTILLAALFAFSGGASALKFEIIEETIRENLDYMDDVWKYDVPYLNRTENSGVGEVVEETKQAEKLSYAKADNIMAALGLLSFDSEGLFHEENIVSYAEYMNILTKLRYGKDAEATNYGVDLVNEEDVTHLMAVKDLMMILGYSMSGDNDSMILKTANQVDLLKKIDYRATKFITRGELSQLVYNALGVDLMEMFSTGSKDRYTISEGKNLLGEVFGMTEISGLCTAAGGIDIYSNANIKMDEICIDAHRFTTKEQDTSVFLGKRVYALLETDSDVQTLAFVGVEDTDTSITLEFSDLYFEGGKLCYEGEESEEKISLSGIETYVYNGEAVSSYAITSALLEKEGMITFAATAKRGEYDIAIISVYETFIVDSASKIAPVRMYFKHGATFEGLNYMDLEEQTGKTLLITKNGKRIAASELAVSDIVSILKSADGSYIHISASSEKKSGTIDAIEDGNLLTIGGKEYVLSASYEKLLADGADVLEPAIGQGVQVSLNTLGYVADIQETEKIIKYGLLKEIGDHGTTMNPLFQAKIFAETGFWEIMDFAETLTVDGKTKMTAEEAYSTLAAEADSIFFKPVRYKQNADGEIIFIDTARNKKEERTDYDAIVYKAVWPDPSGEQYKTDWTRGTNLKGTTYSILDSAKIFLLPDDLEREDQYSVIKRTQIPVEAVVKFDLYNVDDFFRSDVVIYTAPASSGGNYDSTLSVMISKVSLAANEDDELIYKISGYSANRGSGANLIDLYTTAEVKETGLVLQPGDVISYILNADGYAHKIGRFTSVEQAVNPANDRVSFSDYNELLGTVVAVDAAGRTVKVRIGEERVDKSNEYSIEEQGGCLFDSATGKVIPITTADVRPGDRVFLRGYYRKDSVFIYR
ncbi:MAG: hypothetical protein IJA08_03280 [Clostridia bacterium]|nr:hypothetical protein [Clostridia bacterium]